MVKRMRSFLSAVVMFIAIATNAQVTTSTLSGKITDTNKEAIIGATIQAIHEPSGTHYGAITNMDGRYTIQGMRAGGPYKVEISYVGYETKTFKDLTLHLGETENISAKLKESSEVLDEVVVVANATKLSSGASANFKSSQIQSTPTINRNVYDVVSLTPQASVSKNGGLTIAGSNNRYNSFQIDGMVSNDVFGLSSSGTNGGQTGANPISLDAIEEIQVVVSPFDVRQSGFTGGGMNAVTKSGTNDFKASAYTYYNNQDYYGSWSQVNDKKQKLTEQSSKVYGATFGGALIKNKLFFFVSGEYKFDTYPSLYTPDYTSKYITSAQAKQIADKYKEYTGIQESYDSRDVDTRATSLLARLDWNINKSNKLSFRYQLNDSYQDKDGAGASTYAFVNSGYRMKNKTNSFVAELSSHINNSLYNELRGGASYIRDKRDIAYNAPNVTIKNVFNDDKSVNIGTEYSSGANALNQDIYTLEDNLTWYLGNHSITFGTHNEFYKMYNLFIQASDGSWEFSSLDNFLNDTPSKFIYKYSDYDLTGSYKWAGTTNAGQFGFYAQDKWNVTDNFNLTYGVRFDIPTFFNSPTENPTFNESDFSKNYGVRVGDVPDTRIMISPRVGFRWNINEDHSSLLRGGLGIFTGRVPFVWLTNCWNNTGMEMKGTTIYSSDDAPAPSLQKYHNDLVGAMNSAKGTAAKPDIVTVDKNFKFPQVFRANLGYEQTLPYGIKLVLDGLYTKTLNNVFFENLALQEQGQVFAVSPEVPNSAAPYYNKSAGAYSSIVNLKNTSKGHSYSLSAQLSKSFDFGLYMMASYTYGHSYSVNDGTSSVAYSNWKYNKAINPNNKNEVGYSLFDTPHRVLAQVAYTTPKYLNGLMATNVSLIYNGTSGQRYCLGMNETVGRTYNDFNNDGQSGNSLLYIPTKAELDLMSFTTPEDKAKFASWIENDKYAKDHRGQYAERYSNSAPWENHFDLHIGQEFYYLNSKGSKIELTCDITNVANLLNHDWGTYYSSSYGINVLQVDKIDKTDKSKVVPTYSYLGKPLYKNDILSRWHAQIGLKVTF